MCALGFDPKFGHLPPLCTGPGMGGVVRRRFPVVDFTDWGLKSWYTYYIILGSRLVTVQTIIYNNISQIPVNLVLNLYSVLFIKFV